MQQHPDGREQSAETHPFVGHCSCGFTTDDRAALAAHVEHLASKPCWLCGDDHTNERHAALHREHAERQVDKALAGRDETPNEWKPPPVVRMYPGSVTARDGAPPLLPPRCSARHPSLGVPCQEAWQDDECVGIAVLGYHRFRVEWTDEEVSDHVSPPGPFEKRHQLVTGDDASRLDALVTDDASSQTAEDG